MWYLSCQKSAFAPPKKQWNIKLWSKVLYGSICCTAFNFYIFISLLVLTVVFCTVVHKKINAKTILKSGLKNKQNLIFIYFSFDFVVVTYDLRMFSSDSPLCTSRHTCFWSCVTEVIKSPPSLLECFLYVSHTHQIQTVVALRLNKVIVEGWTDSGLLILFSNGN